MATIKMSDILALNREYSKLVYLKSLRKRTAEDPTWTIDFHWMSPISIDKEEVEIDVPNAVVMAYVNQRINDIEERLASFDIVVTD